MNHFDPDVLVIILIWLVPGLSAIVLHEVAHGWAALMLGDTTAREAKRLSLNPLRHVDPLGTVLLPGLLLLADAPFVLGWAKPVPVNFHRLRGGRWGPLLVALAGPLTNFLMLLAWIGVSWVVKPHREAGYSYDLTDFGIALYNLIDAGVAINLVLILFNLIPIPPLDGGRIVGALLPEVLRRPYMRVDRFGMIILLALLATGVLRFLLEPVLDFFFAFLP